MVRSIFGILQSNTSNFSFIGIVHLHLHLHLHFDEEMVWPILTIANISKLFYYIILTLSNRLGVCMFAVCTKNTQMSLNCLFIFNSFCFFILFLALSLVRCESLLPCRSIQTSKHRMSKVWVCVVTAIVPLLFVCLCIHKIMSMNHSDNFM